MPALPCVRNFRYSSIRPSALSGPLLAHPQYANLRFHLHPPASLRRTKLLRDKSLGSDHVRTGPGIQIGLRELFLSGLALPASV